MSQRKKPTVYLAGGMEQEHALGAGWREELTPKLEELGYELLNPCLFEAEQLKGLHTSRLPKDAVDRNGKTFTPKHWHELKQAPFGSALYKRFKSYMQRIIRYDLRVLSNDTDVVVCRWSKATGRGAGTHSELTHSFMQGLPVYVVLEKGVELPGWAHGCTTEIFHSFDDLVAELAEQG